MPDTIWAVATPAGKGGVAVIRISGPAASAAALHLTGRPLPSPRHAALRAVHDGDGVVLDRGLLLVFTAPASFTGEDVVELQLHGSQGVLRALARTLAALPDLRPAGPGEFTRRAFLNGRLDLTQVEALADLIDAETALQARLATRQLDGSFGRQVRAWHDMVLDALARSEAAIDFAADQADVDTALPAELRATLAIAVSQMQRLADDGGAAQRLRQGIVIAVIGPPNAGKSSLVNALSRRDAAIVADLPGTTRDVIEVQLDLQGMPVTLLDTAGLRESEDPLEQLGIARARARAATADIRLLVVPADEPLNPELPPADLIVRSKADLLTDAVSSEDALRVSCHTGMGLADLERAIAEAAARLLPDDSAIVLVRERHCQALVEAAQALQRYLDMSTDDLGLACEDLRQAMQSLGRIDGRVSVDDLLERIFSTFCIGK